MKKGIGWVILSVICILSGLGHTIICQIGSLFGSEMSFFSHMLLAISCFILGIGFGIFSFLSRIADGQNKFLNQNEVNTGVYLCDNCGKQVDKGDAICKHCGAILDNSSVNTDTKSDETKTGCEVKAKEDINIKKMNCPKCGAIIEENAIMCDNCGALM